jgi:hypothetical protein
MPLYRSGSPACAVILAICFAFLGGCVTDKENADSAAGQKAQPVQLAEMQKRPDQPLIPQDRQAFLEKKRAQKEARGPKRFDKPSEAQEFFAMKRVPFDETSLPTQKYVQAIAQTQQMPVFSSRLNQTFTTDEIRTQDAKRQGVLSTWTGVGPGNVGGRTRALVIHPSSPNIMYAGGVAGGVWKTTDSGATWTPLGDLFANMAVCSLVIDPVNPQILYAGTGEGFFNIDAVRGAGIFKTTDGGATWTQLQSTVTSDFHYVNRLAVSPNDHNRLYAATRTGLWASSDAGATWGRLYNASAVNGVTDLVVRTNANPDTLIMACGIFTTASILYSNNGGSTWSTAYTETNMDRTSLALAPSNQNYVYALASSGASGNYRYGMLAVLQSIDGGASWHVQTRNTDGAKLNTTQLSNSVYAFYSTCYSGSDAWYNQGWYDNVIAVDPKNHEIVWAGGIDLYRSNDQGKNWGLASCWWANPVQGSFFVHADQHAIVFHPNYDGQANTTMFVGNDGGIFRTTTPPTAVTNASACSSTGNYVWTNLNNGYGVTQFYYGAVYPGGDAYFGGAQDNGTIRGTSAAGANAWTRLQGGDGGAVAVNPQNTQVLYAEYTNLSLTKSINGGSSFVDAISGVSGSFLFIAPFVMDPNAPDTLWLGGDKLWRTTNAAANWTQASASISGGGLISAMAVYKGDSNSVAIGTQKGYVATSATALSANSGTAWTGPQVVNGYISSLAYAPGNKNTLYATCSTFGQPHILKSTDRGATWTNIGGSGAGALPDVPASTVAPDPNNPNRLYVGTDIGVYVTNDGGASWAVEHTGFPNVITSQLVVEEQSKRLYAFTHGRGTWHVPLPPAHPSAALPAAALLLGQ